MMSNKAARFLLAALLVLVMCVVANTASASPEDAVPNVNREMMTPGFWIGKLSEPDKVIMTPDEIMSFNKDIIQKLPDLVYDLVAYPASLDRQQLLKLLNKRPFPEEDRYMNGRKVDGPYYDNLKNQMNLAAVKDSNEVAYAFTVKRTSIRTFPTADESLTEPEDHEFDYFQETAVGPAEPVLILHKSLDGCWCFVQIYNYCGWMPAGDVAVARDKSGWLAYLNNRDFLVVTGSRLTCSFLPSMPGLSEMELTMGAKLPLAGRDEAPGAAADQTADNYIVNLPARGNDGELQIKPAAVPMNSDVSAGYLPYTRANVIRQAFKMLGERYGWGGMFNGRDCSAFVMDVYKSFGLMLPRNGDEQEQSAGRTVSFDSLTADQRAALIDTLMPGASLHTPTHEMLYLGKHEGRQYVIHDIYSYGDINNKNPDGTLGKIVLNKVVVSDLNLPRRNGKLLIDSLTSGKQIESQSRPERSDDGDISVYVNGNPVFFPDQKPYLDRFASRVYVPVRFVTEAMGATVAWDQREQKATIRKAEKVIVLTIGDKNAIVNGETYTLDAVAKLQNGRTMVPLRFVGGALGAGIQWAGNDSGGGRVDLCF